MPGRHGVKNTLAVGDSRIHGGDWRNQIRHDNRAAIQFTGIRNNRFQHLAIAKMNMPVVWAANFHNLR